MQYTAGAAATAAGDHPPIHGLTRPIEALDAAADPRLIRALHDARCAAFATTVPGCFAEALAEHPGIDPETNGRRSMMAQRRLVSIPLLVLGATVLVTGMVTPVLAGAAVSQSSHNKGSIDACVVLPGFAAQSASFSIHTTGPKNFDETATFSGSACSSYARVPPGQYTLTQSDTAPGFHLAQIYCFNAGSADQQAGSIDLPSASVTIKVSKPTTCLFAEFPGGGGGGGGGAPTTKKGTQATTTTTTPTTPTTHCVYDPGTDYTSCFTASGQQTGSHTGQ